MQSNLQFLHKYEQGKSKNVKSERIKKAQKESEKEKTGKKKSFDFGSSNINYG